MKRWHQFILVAAATALAPAALAHSIGSHSAGFAADHAHPHIGLEHLVAIVAVVILAVIWRRCR